MIFSSAIQRLKTNPMAQFLARADELEKGGAKIIHFEIGDPDFPTPKHIMGAAIQSLRKGETHYGDSCGLTELRDAICRDIKKELGFLPQKEQVIIAPGLSLIYFLLCSIANPGDEVIVPDPGFAPYYSIFDFLGIKPVSVLLKENDGFIMRADEIYKKITKKTKLIIINSPHNPTGAVIDKKEIDKIADLAKEKNISVLSDEVYSKIIYEGRHYSPGTKDLCRETTIILNSFSKSYAMTGWRLGYLIGSSSLISKIDLLIQNTIFSVPTFIQRAGIEALAGGQGPLKQMLKEYKKRRDVLVEGLNSLKLYCSVPKGAFYVFANIHATGFKSEAFAEFILKNAGVCCLPGNLFGKGGEGYARLAYTIPLIDIKEGLRRMEKALRKLK